MNKINENKIFNHNNECKVTGLKSEMYENRELSGFMAKAGNKEISKFTEIIVNQIKKDIHSFINSEIRNCKKENEKLFFVELVFVCISFYHTRFLEEANKNRKINLKQAMYLFDDLIIINVGTILLDNNYNEMHVYFFENYYDRIYSYLEEFNKNIEIGYKSENYYKSIYEQLFFYKKTITGNLSIRSGSQFELNKGLLITIKKFHTDANRNLINIQNYPVICKSKIISLQNITLLICIVLYLVFAFIVWGWGEKEGKDENIKKIEKKSIAGKIKAPIFQNKLNDNISGKTASDEESITREAENKKEVKKEYYLDEDRKNTEKASNIKKIEEKSVAGKIKAPAFQDKNDVNTKDGLDNNASEKTKSVEENITGKEENEEELAKQYYFGLNRKEKDYTKAFNLALKAAEKGNSYSQYLVGSMYLKGQGTILNYKEAYRWLIKSIPKCSLAYSSLANLDYKSLGASKNIVYFFHYLDKAKESNDNELQDLYNEVLSELLPEEINDIANRYAHGIYPLEKNVDRALDLLKISAEKGDIKSQKSLADIYYYGQLGISKSYKNAAKWMLSSANSGDVNSQYLIGLMYYYGDGVEQNYQNAYQNFYRSLSGTEEALTQSIELFITAYYKADNNNDDFFKILEEKVSGENLFAIVERLNDNDQISKDFIFKLYVICAQKEYSSAFLTVADYYYNQKKYNDTFYWYKKAALQNSNKALYRIALMYLEGKGTEKNLKNAFFYCKRAALRGNIKAANLLGEFYRDGVVVNKNYDDAIYWFRVAVQENDLNAQINLSELYYETGEYLQAFHWLEEANKNKLDNDELIFNKYIEKLPEKYILQIGELYNSGKQVPLDYNKAYKIYNLLPNNNEAQYKIALLYLYGYGVEKNEAKAYQLLQKNAYAGNALAQAQIGLLYYDGIYLKQSNKYAYAWLKLAYDNGIENAGGLIKILIYKMKKECNEYDILEGDEIYNVLKKKLPK